MNILFVGTAEDFKNFERTHRFHGAVLWLYNDAPDAIQPEHIQLIVCGRTIPSMIGKLAELPIRYLGVPQMYVYHGY